MELDKSVKTNMKAGQITAVFFCILVSSTLAHGKYLLRIKKSKILRKW